MFCPNCGASLPNNATACTNCGTPWSATPPGGTAPIPGTQPMGQPPMQGEPPTDGKAIASLVLGILSLLCFSIFTGIPAAILGHMSRKNIRQSMGRLKGDGMALAGLILGYIGIGFFVVLMPIYLAIIIPNLLNARLAANEAAAATTMRTIVTTQETYSITFDHGYAPDLATLGQGSGGDCPKGSQQHACLLEGSIAGPECTGNAWCSKGAYKYNLQCAETDGGICKSFLFAAAPLSSSTGRRSYCATEDGIVRSRSGTAQPGSVEACKQWEPI